MKVMEKGIKGDFARTCIGTPYYMAPEIYRKDKYNDKGDVWALGRCLFFINVYLYHVMSHCAYKILCPLSIIVHRLCTI